MSIIRQRTKNLVMAGLLGAIVMGVIGVVVFIIMQVKVIDLQQEVDKLVDIQEAFQEVPKESIYVFDRSVKAGEEIQENHIKQVEIDKSIVPSGKIADKEQILGQRAKMDISRYMPVTKELLFSGEDVADDLREKELSVLLLPQKLEASEFVDIRISFPNGEDYVILSKKQIMDIQRLSEEGKGEEKIWIYITEEELLMLSSAIVDAYLHEANLYAINYILPEAQKAAIPNYPVNKDVYQLMLEDPNIVDKAYEALEEEIREILEMNLWEFEEYEGFIDKDEIDLSLSEPNHVVQRSETISVSDESVFLNEEQEEKEYISSEGLF